MKIPYNIIFSMRLTELKISAWAENLHIISPLEVWLGSKYTFALRFSILKSRMENLENKAILKSISPLFNDWVVESHIGKFLWISQPYFDFNCLFPSYITLTLIWVWGGGGGCFTPPPPLTPIGFP